MGQVEVLTVYAFSVLSAESPRGLVLSSKCVPQKHLKSFVYFEFGFEVIKLDYLDREAVKANYERK